MKKKNVSQVERHLETMFEQALYSDLSIVFQHPTFPMRMRFDVHQAIVSQAPFFKQLLDNQHLLDNEHPSTDPKRDTATNDGRSVMTLNINLLQALLQRKFVLTPFQHIVRRKWQRPYSPGNSNHNSSSNAPRSNKGQQPLFSHILASHVRYALQWMYCNDRSEFFEEVDEDDTLRVLAIAILFQLDDLAHACAERYTTFQLSMFTIMRDLEHICQLPRDHSAYLQLRDAALRLLLRYGPDNPEAIAELPVDYMADVLNADLLCVHSEYERYCLLRDVLAEFMLSVGEIQWTPQGPVDQDHKRLSGFIKPQPPQANSPLLTTAAVRSRKRKRIPSEDLMVSNQRPRLARLSFSATIPFQALVADPSSGGVIDKATVLSYLLRNTINYSNMSFGQLSTVRTDGIVDESIVFRALWQRMALQRIMFPERSIASSQQEVLDTEALDEYFDVDSDRRHQILLGVPKYRFCVSVRLPPPSVDSDWTFEEPDASSQLVDTILETDNDDDDDDNEQHGQTDADDKQDDNDRIYDDEELDKLLDDPSLTMDECTPFASTPTATPDTQPISATQAPSSPTQVIWKTSRYSSDHEILGSVYRVHVDAQSIPGRLLQVDDDEREYDDTLICRFGLDCVDENTAMSATQSANGPSTPQPQPHPKRPQLSVDKFKSSTYPSCSSRTASSSPAKKPAASNPKIKYSIYCLNRHQHVLENDHVNEEDRVMIPVSEQSKDSPGEPWSGSCFKVRMDGYDHKHSMSIDLVVVMELEF